MLENVPMIYSSTMIAGLKYPVVAASLCATYTLSRVPYTLGYRTGDPNNVSVPVEGAYVRARTDGRLQRNVLGPFPLGVPIVATVAEFCEYFAPSGVVCGRANSKLNTALLFLAGWTALKMLME